MINAIELNSTASESYLNEYGNTLAFLPNIRHINLFVGENNSGKIDYYLSLLGAVLTDVESDELNMEHYMEYHRNNVFVDAKADT